MFAFKKNSVIQQKIRHYLDEVDACLDLFMEGMSHYLKNGVDDHFKVQAKKTDASESRADDLRREIESELYEKSLLPEAREDILTIIERVDHIPNAAESVLRRIYTENLAVPEKLNHQLHELARLGTETGHLLTESAGNALAAMDRVKEFNRLIDDNESIGDTLEQDMIYNLFRDGYDPVERVLYRDLIQHVGSILDEAETASSKLMIFSIKRQV